MKLTINLIASLLLLSGMALAQSSSGTMNSLSTNPRQNQELTNSTGTESGQPSDSVPGSEAQDNGLVTPTANMVGSGSNGNMNQAPASKTSSPSTAEQSTAPNPQSGAKNAATNSSAKPAGKSTSDKQAKH